MHRAQAPYWQLFNAISAFRLLRAALHHERSRAYLISVSQITPVLMHFGSLVMCFLYFAAVVAMELLAKEPEMREVPSSSWMGGTNASVYVNKCKNDLPNFDCPSSALLTMFMMFTGTHLHGAHLVRLAFWYCYITNSACALRFRNKLARCRLHSVAKIKQAWGPLECGHYPLLFCMLHRSGHYLVQPAYDLNRGVSQGGGRRRRTSAQSGRDRDRQGP